jgi:gluconate 2-dehydrogenase gamma chain
MTADDARIDRREALAGMGFSAMAAYGVGTPTWHRFQRLIAEGGAPGFFTAAETAQLRLLADMIIPRDAKSGSATDSGALSYMDFVVGESSPKTQQAWREGLRWYDEECQRRYGQVLVECSESQRGELLDAVAWPGRTDAALKAQGEFFSRLRNLTGAAFFSSKMGVHDLGYMGNVPNPDWQGAPPAALAELGVSYEEWDRKYGDLR